MRSGGRRAIAVGILLLAGLPLAALAHGGHGKPEIQFLVEPADAVPDPGAAVVRIDGASATREDFLAYIDAVAAFQMRADLLQRDFLLRYWVAEALSRYHPEDINLLMPPLTSGEPLTGPAKERIDAWIYAQADLFARLLLFYRRAVDAGREKDARVDSVLDCFAAHVKAEVLEDYVGYGPMEPTPAAVREHAKGLADGDLAAILARRDTATGAERRSAVQRWVRYRQAILREVSVERSIDAIHSPAEPPATPIGAVGGRTLTLGEMLAVFGPLPDDAAWEAIKRSRSAQMLRAYALAQVANSLAIVRGREARKIRVGRILYLAADEAVRRYGTRVLGEAPPPSAFELHRRIAYYETLRRFEQVFDAESRKEEGYGSLRIDRAFLAGVRWRVRFAFTPDQAAYF